MNGAMMIYVNDDQRALIDALPLPPNKRRGRGEKIAAIIEKPYHFTDKEVLSLIDTFLDMLEACGSEGQAKNSLLDSLNAEVQP